MSQCHHCNLVSWHISQRILINYNKQKTIMIELIRKIPLLKNGSKCRIKLVMVLQWTIQVLNYEDLLAKAQLEQKDFVHAAFNIFQISLWLLTCVNKRNMLNRLMVIILSWKSESIQTQAWFKSMEIMQKLLLLGKYLNSKYHMTLKLQWAEPSINSVLLWLLT